MNINKIIGVNMESISHLIMIFPTHENSPLILMPLSMVVMALRGIFLEIVCNILRNIFIKQEFSISNSK